MGTIAGLMALGALGGGLLVISARSEPDPASRATETIEAYLAAWEGQDLAAMRSLVAEPPPSFDTLHRQVFDGLDPRRITVEHGEIEIRRGQAETPLRVTLALPEAGSMAYDSRLRVQPVGTTWLVRWEPRVLHPDLREGFTLDVVTTERPRAPILAHDRTPLVGRSTIRILGIEPGRVRDRRELLGAVAEVLPGHVERLERILDRDNLRPDWFYPFAELPEETSRPIWQRLARLPGIHTRREEGRATVASGFALHVLGDVGPLPPERAQERGGDHREGDRAGLYGLEAALDDRLTGGRSIRVVLREPDGDLHEVLHRSGTPAPEPVRTTLDRSIQQAVENTLVGVTSPTAIVVVDANNGAIRGAASRPLSGYNRAFEGRYLPGWAVTPVTVATLLHHGTGPGTRVTCSDEEFVGGRRITLGTPLGAAAEEPTEEPTEEPGTATPAPEAPSPTPTEPPPPPPDPRRTLAGALAHECRTGLADLAAGLERGDLAGMARRFGFGVDYDLPVAAVGGSFPPTRDVGERALTAIGRERVQASPLHLATVIAAAATGRWHVPFLLPAEGSAGRRGIPEGIRSDLDAVLATARLPGRDLPPDVRALLGTAPGEAGAEHGWFAASDGELGLVVLAEDSELRDVEGRPGPRGEAGRLGERLLRELVALGVR